MYIPLYEWVPNEDEPTFDLSITYKELYTKKTYLWWTCEYKFIVTLTFCVFNSKSKPHRCTLLYANIYVTKYVWVCAYEYNQREKNTEEDEIASRSIDCNLIVEIAIKSVLYLFFYFSS